MAFITGVFDCRPTIVDYRYQYPIAQVKSYSNFIENWHVKVRIGFIYRRHITLNSLHLNFKSEAQKKGGGKCETLKGRTVE